MTNNDYIANLLAKTRAGNGPVEMSASQVSTDVIPPRNVGLPPIAPTYYGGAPAIGGSIFSNDDRATAPPPMAPPIDLSQYNLQSPEPYLPPAGTTLSANIGAPPPTLPAIQRAGELAATPSGPVEMGPNYLPQIPPTAPVTPAAGLAPTDDTLLSEQQRQLDVLDDPTRYQKPIWYNQRTQETTSERKKYEKWVEHGDVVQETQSAGINRNKKWSWWEKLGAGALGWLTGGLAGGIKAATDRNYFQKIGDARQREALLPAIGRQQQIASTNAAVRAAQMKPILAQQELQRKIQADKTRFDIQTERLDLEGRRIADQRNRYKVTVDENGLRWKEYINKDPDNPDRPDKEALRDPVTGEQDVDPNFKLYDYTDPTTGTTVQVTGRILSDRGVRQAEFKSRQEQQESQFQRRQELTRTENEKDRQIRVQKMTQDLKQQMSQSTADAVGALSKISAAFRAGKINEDEYKALTKVIVDTGKAPKDWAPIKK